MEVSTEHYVFHFCEDSIAGKEIEGIAALQEDCYRFISSCLSTEASGKIHYHFFDTPQEVGKQYAITHDNDDDEPCNGFALPETSSKDGANHIFAVYNETVKCTGFHEDAHILSYTLGRPQSQFIREGLAMFFDRYWWGIDNTAWTRWYLKEGKLPSIAKLLENDAFNTYADTLTYPIAGSFTEYLIARFGMERYIDFYKACRDDAERAFQAVFSIPVVLLEESFIRHIQVFSLREEIRQLMEQDSRAL